MNYNPNIPQYTPCSLPKILQSYLGLVWRFDFKGTPREAFHLSVGGPRLDVGWKTVSIRPKARSISSHRKAYPLASPALWGWVSLGKATKRSNNLSTWYPVDGNQKSSLHQLRLVVYPVIYRGFSTIPGGCLGFLPSTVWTMQYWFGS